MPRGAQPELHSLHYLKAGPRDTVHVFYESNVEIGQRLMEIILSFQSKLSSQWTHRDGPFLN